jgi:hypothetical protein
MHPLTTWLALVGSIWALFALAEEHLAAPHRAQITRWLRCQTPDWPATFVAVCDSVFGSPTLSGSYLLRTCVASLIAAFLALCLSGVLYPGTSGLMLLVLFLYAPALVSSLALVNLLPGSISILVQRALLQHVREGQGPPGMGTWLVLASAATGVLAVLACTLAFLVVYVSNQVHALQRPVTWIIGYIEFVIKDTAGSLYALQEAALLQPIIMPGMTFPSFGVWFYTPCFPFIWVWLYLLSGVFIRGVTACRLLRAPRCAPGLLDIDARPLYALGAVAVGMVSVVYWTALLWRR